MRFLLHALRVIGLVMSASAAHASVVEFEAINLAGITWRYDYVLTNDTLGVPVDEFTIYFDRTLFANLRDAAALPGWDIVLVQPDLALPDDGFFDGLALGAPLGANTTLTGFSVVFDFLGQGAPGSQSFEFLDAATFSVLDGGPTQSATPPTSVPEPRSLALMLVGLAALGLRRFASRK